MRLRGKRTIIPLLTVLMLLVSCSGNLPPDPVGPVPSESQLAWHEMEYYMFIHFGINTFTDREWGYGDESPGLFDPTGFDAGQWARVAYDAGMKGIIITAKHHDGFCLFPSVYTGHSIKNSPFRNGQGDIIGELRKACDEYGLKLGIYLSPWDRNSELYGTTAYIDYYRNQLRELLAGYGDVFEVWFDGANGGDGYYGGARETRRIDRESYYDWKGTWALVRELQPNAIMFSDAGPDIRWVGNESGLGSLTNWSLLKKDDYYPGSPEYSHLGEGEEDGTHWVPAEVDVSIRPGWFYHPAEDERVKSASELMDIYYSSVGRNGNLLLNVPPDRRGLINEKDIEALMEFRRLRELEFVNEIASGKGIRVSGQRGRNFGGSKINDSDNETYWASPEGQLTAEIEIDLGSEQEVNRIMLQEYIRLGQRIREFRVEVMQEGTWVEVVNGTTVGYKVIRKFPSVSTSKVRIRIGDSKASPTLSNVEIYCAPGG